MQSIKRCGLLPVLLIVLSCEVMGAEHSGRKPNRLIHEKSPYLLQHAYNPVDWYPWGAEAFAKARKENKPIFLSIGYSTCHWCHVMERESFENDDIAALMNQYFVCIKVDREERPDIDKIYMTAVQATTGSGGWPMSVWLTPELKPFFCGTYFPPDSRYGRPGFKDLIQRVHDVWEANHDAVLKQAGEITAMLTQQAVLPGPGNGKLDDAPLKFGYEQFRGSYDEIHGGFGGAPKFPRPVTFNFLLRYFARTHDERARDMMLFTLRQMGEGGMFDQLGGGFHRYSVDDHWLVSHFEKMLYDQAQLVVSYCEAYQIARDPFYADITRRTCDYVMRDMTSPAGGFYSAEDADSEGVEGKFYVWRREEIEALLGESADIFCRYYGVDKAGNWEHGQNILHVTMTLEQAAKLFHKPANEIEKIVAEGREKLFTAREKRIRPHRDDKVLTSWNGLMISALCKAAQTLPGGSGIPAATGPDRDKNVAPTNNYANAAIRAANFILTRHYRDGKLWRTETVPAVVDDYAFFATGLVDLYETTLDPQWLVKARELADQMIELFYDKENGGFFMNDGRDPSVIVRAKEDYDGAEPSGNSMATLLLLRLAEFAGDGVAASVPDAGRGKAAGTAATTPTYREVAEKTLAAFHAHLERAPQAVPQMLCALDFALGKPKQIVIAGELDAPDTQAMLRAVYERYLPNKILILAGSATWSPFFQSLKPIDGKATAYVCENYTCKLPTTDLETFRQELK